MSANSSEKNVTRRNWFSFASVLTVQTQNAFNDNLVKFVIIGLALAVAQGTAIGDNIQFIMSALLPLPFILLAPIAGYFSDHYSKKQVIYACLVVQMLLFIGIAAAVWFHNIPCAVTGFFLLSVQSTFFSPAKQGILKELVGSSRLAFVNGLMQMFTMVGILGGLWLGGLWFDAVLKKTGDPWQAAVLPIGVIGLLATLPLIIGLFIEHSPPHKTAPFTPSIFVRHFVHLRQLMEQRTLRLTAIGISFYWFVAYFLGLIVVSFGLELYPDTAAGGATSASSGMSAIIGVGLMVGSSAVSMLSRRRIELGMVPIGGFGLTLGLLGLGVSAVGSNIFYGSLACIGFFSGFFLVPLVAYLQDEAEEQHRGRVLSATALLTSLAGFLAIGLGLGLKMIGISPSVQVLLFAPLMLFGTLLILKLQPQNFFRFSLLTILKLIYHVDARHLERVPKSGGVILIANHASYIDWLIISAACPRPIRFIFNKRYSRLPVAGWFLDMFSSIPVSPTSIREMIRKASDAAGEGDVVCIFPEGQLSRTGMLNEMKKGFNLIARKAEAPVLPVYMDSLWGSIFSFERKRYFWKWPLRFRYPVRVNFGDPIPHGQATPLVARKALMALSAESLESHPALQNTLDVALVRALKKKPGATCLIEYSKRKRLFKRGQVLALSIALSSYWKRSLPGDSNKIAIFLPPGSTPIYLNIGLILAGKIPVNLPFHHKPDLDYLSDRLNENGIRTIITSRAFFPQLVSLNESVDPEYHLLDMRSEIDAAGLVRIMVERLLVRLEPTRSTLRRLELGNQEAAGKTPEQEIACGFISSSPTPETSSDNQAQATPTPPSTVFLSHRNILANVQQLRLLSVLERRDAIFCENPLTDLPGIYFSLFLPVFAHTTTVMRSISRQVESDSIEAILRENSVSTLLLSQDLCLQILAEDRWHPELREQLRQLLAFSPIEKLSEEELSSHTGLPILMGHAPAELGAIVSLNMTHPQLASTLSPDQKGHSPGSIGRLLPGIAVRSENDMEISSASLPEGWHALPEGTRMDEDGFLFDG